jgi:hypothetical protein
MLRDHGQKWLASLNRSEIAQYDGAQYDSAQYDGAQYDGTQYDGAVGSRRQRLNAAAEAP